MALETQHMNSTHQPAAASGLTVLQADQDFKFDCHPQVSCFTRCCRDITIFLSPYDIIRMKQALGLSSEEFLEKYTVSLIGSVGLPVVLIKMHDDESKRCPFVTPKGCSIYEHRPWPCRIFPLRPESTKQTEKAKKEYYSVMDIPFCEGLRENKVMTVDDWKKTQGIPKYMEMEAPFKKITTSPYLQGKKISNKKIQDMFHMAAYDIDLFRRFVFESKFLQIYDIADEDVERMRSDDVVLYEFAMKWLEHGLIGHHVLKLRPEAMGAGKEKNA